MNRHTYFAHDPGQPSTPASKAVLFGCFGLGLPLTVFTPKGWVTGTVTRVSLESGFTPPARPHCFNVVLQTNDGQATVFVRTAD